MILGFCNFAFSFLLSSALVFLHVYSIALVLYTLPFRVHMCIYYISCLLLLLYNFYPESEF